MPIAVIPFPIAFLVTAFITDLAVWQSGNSAWAVASMWLLGAAIVMALLAAVFGFTDFSVMRKFARSAPHGSI